MDSEARPDLSDNGLITLLRRLVVESDRFAEVFSETRGMHRTDLNAVALIMHADQAGRSLSPGQLAEALHLSASSVSALLDRLEAAGHVHRARSDADRRRVELHVRESALEVGREFFAPLGAEMAEAWAVLDDSERLVVSRFLELSIAATTKVSRTLTQRDV
ncbi:MAG TPA: MarR family transcriptional regulator [Actinokineospora sp.]|nr:MarR family transcriptional regulator [Actinokineospora sp.]